MPTGKMSLRRGFTLAPGENVIVIEDVITTGGSTKEVIDIVRAARRHRGRGGLDHRPQRRRGRSGHSARGARNADRACRWNAERMPDVLKGEPVTKPGSSRLMRASRVRGMDAAW